MKSYTDITQSKKLAEILPLDCADMGWNVFADNSVRCLPINDWDLNKDGSYSVKFIPAYSLAALLNIFPCSKESPIVNLTRGGWNPSFTRRWFATWEDEDKNILYSCDGTSPIDAVVELIMKLHKQKLI